MYKLNHMRFDRLTCFWRLGLTCATSIVANSAQSDLTVTKPASDKESPASEWLQVTSKRGRFTVLMPGKPTEDSYVWSTPKGKLEWHSVTTEPAGTIAYSIWYFEQPTKPRSAKDGDVLAIIRGKLLEDGKAISERKMAADNHEVTEFVLERLSGQARVTVRVQTANKMVYMAMVVMPNKLFTSPKNPDTPKKATALMDHFFNSLQFNK